MKVSTGPRCFKLFHTSKTRSLYHGSCLKPSINPMNFSIWAHQIRIMSKYESLTQFRVTNAMQCGSLVKSRSFSGSFQPEVNRGSSRVVTGGKTLPWLEASGAKEVKGSEKKSAPGKDDNISWGKSDMRLERTNGRSSWDNSIKKFDKMGSRSSSRSSRKESGKRLEKAPLTNTGRSSWELSAEAFTRKDERKVGPRDPIDHQQKDYIEKDVNFADEVEEEMEAVIDPRWDKIKTRVRGMMDIEGRTERPDFQRWNKQENWGKKTWKEATESTVPKMVGEGIYGVGPVLAAFSARRREFYTLYVQEGLDLSNNNRKKKDRKGFEKILRMAEKNAITIKEISKHDLNMVVDNRPHQGLVLDSSPLEMVKIKELDPISVEEDKGALWVALDEVTDPQNLGAIIRSSYFFGANGIVLCAKNSAPLSGVVSKASAGSLELMELRYCKNMMQFLTSSAENGWRVLGGSVSQKAVPLKEVCPGKPTILVLGSEGTGLRPLVERSCTELIRIPGNVPVEVSVVEGGDDDQDHNHDDNDVDSNGFRSFLAVESLNVSVAAGVLLHHLVGDYDKNE